MEIFNFERIIVVKYLEIGADTVGNRTNYIRYKCLPYTSMRSRAVKAYVKQLNDGIRDMKGWHVSSKIIVGLEKVEEYLALLRTRLIPNREGERSCITVKVYVSNEKMPHEDDTEAVTRFYHDYFGEQFIGENEVGTDLLQLLP